ncbi:MAG: hypothetical protein A2452_03820 [Candidatus Firestonebacteria bacterium RIFOXYC2_FULL_39_67]|nr:MAG: hypothetical protein A2536_08555 [Candidatus Firestonebacteria bacterium RIFOXYD2_FULL_39_29]OGF54694.1 MAG: hypothetical protein A2452_03820 [Candidatus Firestonebacteria bacterium RIFOXYC2_FULL_39_67]
MAAESTSGTPATTTSMITSVPVLPNLKPELDKQGQEIEQIKVAHEKIENSYKELNAKYEALVKANSEILKTFKAFEAGLKVNGDKLTIAEKNLENLKVTLDVVNEALAETNKKAEADKLILTGLKTQTESFRVKLDIAKDDIKVGSDEARALKDALSIMRTNFNSNITDTIELKKSVSEIKVKESGKPAEGIMAWEYLGIVTSGVAVLALVLSITK